MEKNDPVIVRALAIVPFSSLLGKRLHIPTERILLEFVDAARDLPAGLIGEAVNERPPLVEAKQDSCVCIEDLPEVVSESNEQS